MSAPTLRFLSISLGKACRHRGKPLAREIAYAGRAVIYDPRTGVTHDFSNRSADVEASDLLGFKGDISEFIHQVVFSEPQKRPKAVEGRTLILAIAHELEAKRRLEFAISVALFLVSVFGVGVYYSIHRPSAEGDERNFHIHFVFSARKVVEGNRLGPKTRELDALKTGGRHVEEIRAWVTARQNEMLRADGHIANLEHRSLERLGIKRAPSRHLGVRQTAIKRRIHRNIRKLPVPQILGTAPARIQRALPQPLNFRITSNEPSTQPTPTSQLPIRPGKRCSPCCLSTRKPLGRSCPKSTSNCVFLKPRPQYRSRNR